jgi:hypothetical protein
MIPVDSIRIEQIEADGTTTKINSMDLDDVPCEFEGVNVIMASAEVSPIKATAQVGPIKPKTIIDKTKLFSQMNDIFAKDTHHALKDKPVYQKRAKPGDNIAKPRGSVSPRASAKNKEKSVPTTPTKPSSPKKGEWKVGGSPLKGESPKLASLLDKESKAEATSLLEEAAKILKEETSKPAKVEAPKISSPAKEEAPKPVFPAIEEASKVVEPNNASHSMDTSTKTLEEEAPTKQIAENEPKETILSPANVVETEVKVTEIAAQIEETVPKEGENVQQLKEIIPNAPLVNQLLKLPRDETVLSETDETDENSKEVKSCEETPIIDNITVPKDNEEEENEFSSVSSVSLSTVSSRGNFSSWFTRGAFGIISFSCCTFSPSFGTVSSICA